MIRYPKIAALILILAFVTSIVQAQTVDERRIDSLISKLTLDEKISLVAGTGFDSVAIPRLGIPALKMTDGPIGVRSAPATAFPSPIALAATFDPSTIQRVSAAIARETKAKGFNVLLGPCVNILRTPFGGRNFESFGEDPYLASRMSVAYINGMQGENVIPSLKHYAANNQEVDRMFVDVRVDERALNELYFPAFKASVKEAKVWTVMASYNKLNGFWASENPELLTNVLKKRWGFDGLVVSDWGATHSTAAAINAGLDLEMPTGLNFNAEKIKAALKSGEVRESQLDEMIRRLLRTAMRAGLITGTSTDRGALDTPEHRRIALDAARGGLVLLKNDQKLLPIEPSKVRSVAVIGPNADTARIGGGGSAQVIPFYSVSPLEGIRKVAGDKFAVNFSPGIVSLEDTTPIPSANLTTPDGKQGLLGEYYANVDFKGTPAFTRVDANLDFRWGTGSPAPDFPDDQFSNRWTGFLTAPESGRYAISLSSNDGGRLYVDDKLVVDVWGDHATLKGAAAIELKAGQKHKILVEHYESRGNADLVLGWRKLETDIVEKAAETARKSDVAIVFAGLSDAVEVEARDRASLELPKEQEELIRAVVRANPRTIVVTTSGAPLVMENWIGDVPALMQAFYYGQEGGNAIAEALFGVFSPSGKLPTTFLKRWEDSNAFGRYPGDGKSVDYSEGLFVGYRWHDQREIEPRFAFGHGLSYAEFKYSTLHVKRRPNGGATVTFSVQNIGKTDAAEVAQLYVAPRNPPVERAPKELKSFRKMYLKAGEKVRVSIDLDLAAFAYYEPATRRWISAKGDYGILVGSSSRDIRLTRPMKIAKTQTVEQE